MYCCCCAQRNSPFHHVNVTASSPHGINDSLLLAAWWFYCRTTVCSGMRPRTATSMSRESSSRYFQSLLCAWASGAVSLRWLSCISRCTVM